MKKIIFVFILWFFSTCIFAREIKMEENNVIIINISHVLKNNSPKGKAALRFKELMESEFPGKVRVDIYEDNTLFKDREEFEAVELGATNIIFPTFGKVSGLLKTPELQVFDLPFLFDTDKDVLKLIQSNIGKRLMDLSNKSKHVQVIELWPGAFRHFSGPKPFKTPDDFKGLNVRIEPNNITMQKLYENLGVSKTIPLAFADLPSALKKQGAFKVDACENPFFNFYTAKLYDMQSWITLSQHDFIGYAVVVNKRWLKSLPTDVRESILKNMKIAGEYHLEISRKESEETLKDIQAKGVKIYTWTKQEKEEFKKAVVPVHLNFLNNINKDFLLEVYEVMKTQ